MQNFNKTFVEQMVLKLKNNFGFSTNELINNIYEIILYELNLSFSLLLTLIGVEILVDGCSLFVLVI